LQGTTQVAEYTYNGAGQRVKKVTQTETRIFHYDLWGHLIAETNQAGQMLAEYVCLGDQLLAMITPGEAAYYFHNDHLGTPQVLTDDSQAISWKAAYTPFGDAVTSIATVENPFRFPGQYYDQETGLHYNYFRYYNPQTERYITPDPIGLEGGVNLFAYVENNPSNFTDPLGLRIQWNGYIVTNLQVIRNLIRLNQEIVKLGIKDDEFALSITGGDRFKDTQGNIRSLTTYEIVKNSSSTSPHLFERGARALDLCVSGVSDELFDKALRKTEFLPVNTERNYTDQHTHIALPNLIRYYYYAPLPR
jgi:RHS repeat-associated protein